MNRSSIGKRKKELFFVPFFLFAYIAATRLCPLAALHTSARLGITVRLDLLLCCVLSLALMEGKRYAAPYALTVGFVFDVAVGNPYTFSPIVFFLCSYFAEKAAAPFSRKTPLSVMLCAAQVFLIKAVFSFLYLAAVSGDASVGELLYRGVLPEYLINLFGAGVVFAVMRILTALFRIPVFEQSFE